MRARFDFVAFNYMDELGVVMVNRRGRNGDSLDRVKAEIGGLLADLREHGATRGEIARATGEITQSLAIGPYGRSFTDVAVRNPNALHPRAWVLAMYDVFGWPADLTLLFKKTPVVAVGRALGEALAKDRVQWFALLPDPDRVSQKGR